MQYSIHLYVSLYSSNVKSISFITNSFIQQLQKLARLTTVNQLLEQLNTSVPIEKVEIRKLISQAYATINQPDSVTKRY